MLLRGRWSIVEEHLSIPHDDAQKIIEVVRDSSRQQAHSFHLLRLAKLILEIPSFGNVFHNDFEMRERTILSADSPSAQPNREDLAIFAFPIDFGAVHAPAGPIAGKNRFTCRRILIDVAI